MEQTINTVVKHSTDVDYTKRGVVVSHTKNTKTFVTKGKKTDIHKHTSNTCMIVKNVGCSGLANHFFGG